MALHGIGPLRFALASPAGRNEVFELQLQLIDQALAALRARPYSSRFILASPIEDGAVQGFRGPTLSRASR